MCKIDSQLKQLIVLKYLILETPSSLYSGTLDTLSPMFSGINNNNFFFFVFSKLSFLCLFLQISERKKIFVFQYF